MAITVKHSKVSTIPDGDDSSLVRPSDWNADHTLSGTVPIENGGTGASTATNAINNLLPSQTGNNGKFLTTNGTNTSWSSPSGSGDVVGPASATDNAITRFDGTTGKLIQNSTVTIDDNGNIINSNSVGFDTTPATVPTTVGTMSWDDGDGVPTVALKGGNVNLQVGTQEYARVYNDSGTTLTKGQVVYISGAQGNRVAVKLARADVEATSFGTLGLVAETMANGAEGFIIVSGALYKLNTLGLTAGSTVYLSPTTAGAITTNKPQAPDQLVVLGWVERVDNIVGSIYVKVDNGYELDELHDVQITSPQSGNVLIYDASTSPIGVWKNANLTDGTGITITEGAGSVTIANAGVTALSAGTGISVSGSTGNVTVTNTAPDQTVALTAGTGISVTGTYPSFTVANTGVTSVGATAPIASSGGTTPTISITQATTSTDGYLSSTDWNTFNNKGNGTVTSVGGTGTVNGITLSGTVTSSGNLTLGGTLSNVSLTSQVTGTLPIANGGTGQTTQTAAFDALSPTTTKGDLIVDDGTNNIRLPVGTNTQVLTADSTTASGLKWAAAGGFSGGTLSSQLLLAAGTASAGTAPLEFQSGTLNTTAEAGAMEYDGTVPYFSMAASTRGALCTEQIIVLSSSNTLTSQTAAQPIFDGGGGPANGAVTLPVGTYQFECVISLTSLSNTSGSFGFAFGGTATFTQGWETLARKGTSLTGAATPATTYNTAANTTITAASTGTIGFATIRGIIRVTVSGTVIPQLSQSTASAAVVGANSYFKISPIGSSTVVTVGNWS